MAPIIDVIGLQFQNCIVFPKELSKIYTPFSDETAQIVWLKQTTV